jgi:hypothetical protein
LTALISVYHPEHICVRLYLPWEKPSPVHSLAQIDSALDNDCSVGGYVWAYPFASPQATAQEGVDLLRSAGVRIPVLWVDCETYSDEPGPDRDWLLALSVESDRLGLLAGIYSAAWYWERYMENTRALSHLPLWVADYQGGPTLDDFKPFGGWTQAAGKQWSGSPVDRSVFLESVTR